MILVHALQMRKLRAEKRPGSNPKRQSEPVFDMFSQVVLICMVE